MPLTDAQKAARAASRKINADVERRAAELKGRGFSYPAIAEQLGISLGSAYNAVTRYYAASMPVDKVERERMLSVARLDRALVAIWPLIEPTAPEGQRPPPPSLEAVDRLIRIEAHRMRLLGLNREPELDRELLFAELRAAATAENLDPDEAVNDAMAILARHGR